MVQDNCSVRALISTRSGKGGYSGSSGMGSSRWFGKRVMFCEVCEDGEQVTGHGVWWKGGL